MVMKSRRIRTPRACGIHSIGVWWGGLKEIDHLEDKT
jgi:hypothetical protein